MASNQLDEQLDDSPSPTDLPNLSGPSLSRPLFFSGTSDDQLTPDSLHLVTGEGTADDVDASDSGDPWSGLDESSDDGPRTSTESQGGTDRSEKPAQLLSQRQMRKTGAEAVKIAGGMAHTVGAKTEAQQSVGLYLADDDDAENIGHPLADIFHRRGDVVGGKLSPDANDALRALMGFAGYFTKQIAKIGAVRQIEAQQRAGQVQTFPGEAVA